jgi:Fic family protein
MSGRRSTTPLSDEQDLLILDEDQVAAMEARNGLLQFDEVLRLVEHAAQVQQIEITPKLISQLNRLAIQGIRRSAGSLRTIGVQILNTPHQPPPHEEVDKLLGEMCSYVNRNWRSRNDDLADALHIAAYLMWRLNWIHPFRDGNGRTSRAVSYLTLSVRIGHLLPGSPTIADLIVENRQPYYEALDEADAAWQRGIVSVGAMEALLQRLLKAQIESAFRHH